MQYPHPIENCYWVEPGKFLAGEYPRDKDMDLSREKLKALLDAGVSHFIDLTEESEPLAGYMQIVRKLGFKDVSHQRYPVQDCSIPSSRDVIVDILDAIDHAMAEGGIVYLHCWGGVGRTGTIVGCWLSRHGYKGVKALDRLNTIWAQCPKSLYRASPERGSQTRLILSWDESAGGGP